MPVPVSDALGLAVAGLRRRRDEAQLTQFVVGAARSDTRFAGRLAAILVAHSPQAENFVGGGIAVPSELVCEAEKRVWASDAESRGFVDLLFRNEARDFTLLVELKLHSGYGHAQVKRYLEGLHVYRRLGGPESRAGLLAVTRNPPAYGEPERRTPGWLGSVRWAVILDDLRALEHEDKRVEELWRTVLGILEWQGDFGMLGINIDDVQAWGRYVEGRQQLVGLLRELSQPSISLVRESLATHAGVDPDDSLARLVPRGKHGKRVVFPGQQRVHLRVAIPAAHTGYRMRLQFRPGRGGPSFSVEARHPDTWTLPPAVQDNLRRISEDLRAEWGMESAAELTDFRRYWRRPHPLNAWAGDGGADVVGRLLKIARDDIGTLVRSGLFSASDGLCVQMVVHEPPAELEEQAEDTGIDEIAEEILGT